MMQGIVYPAFAEQIAEYLAAALYFTSDLAMPAVEKKALIAAFCGNTDLCRITEDLVFTDPYMVCDRNRWTSPQLDQAAASIRDDAELKRAVSALKLKFLARPQALLHGDLHTGSIMVTEQDTKVIDPEFAFVGPMGFDVGKLLGELLLSFFSQRGHETSLGQRDAYRGWILAVTEQVWTRFACRFVELWDAHPTGDAYPRALFAGPDGTASLRIAQAAFMRRLFEDALGFAGAAMIRRTLGLAHNVDMETIADPDLRAACERRNLELARDLLVHAADIPTSPRSPPGPQSSSGSDLRRLVPGNGLPHFVVEQRDTQAVGRGEALQPVPAAVHQPAGTGEIAFDQRLLDRTLALRQERREEATGEAGLEGPLRLPAQAIAQAQRLPVMQVVGPAGQLHEATAAEVGAVGRAFVAQVAPVIVEIEGMAVRRAVEARRPFRLGQESFALGPDGRQRHQQHRLVGQPCGTQAGEHGRQMLPDRRQGVNGNSSATNSASIRPLRSAAPASLGLPSRAQVSGPTTPSASSSCARWKPSKAASVPGPKRPSMRPGGKPASVRRFCKSSTSAPWAPRRRTGNILDRPSLLR